MMDRTFVKSIFLLMIIFTVMGCSSEATPPTIPENINDNPLDAREPASERALWGLWNITFDPGTMEVIVEPARNLQAHFDITNMIIPPACNDCLTIAVNSFDPVTRIMDIDVTLRNPFSISGHDVRGILLVTDAGHLITNPDAWTEKWDIPGGDKFNPFRAYAKDEPYRIFPGLASKVEKYLVYIPLPLQYQSILYVVDASWPGNCKEPYEITNFWQEVIYDSVGSQGNIYIDVYDWQEDVDYVAIKIPDVSGTGEIILNNIAGNIWSGQIQNSEGAPAGDYRAGVIAASLQLEAYPLYNFFPLTITES